MREDDGSFGSFVAPILVVDLRSILDSEVWHFDPSSPPE
jgi:hypothetical protein